MFRMDEEDESKAGNPAPAIVEKALFDSRTILLTGGVDDKLAQRVCERLLALPNGTQLSAAMVQQICDLIRHCPRQQPGVGQLLAEAGRW